MIRVLVLGSTGSIGVQALEVIDAAPDMVACGLACGGRRDEMAAQAAAHGVEHTACAGGGGTVEHEPGLDGLIEASRPDIVLNALVGAAGLRPTLAAIGRGLPVALANKETLVAGGDLVAAARARTGAALVPVDSEHSALFQLLEGVPPERVEAGILTASGGPFRGRSAEELAVGDARAGAAPPHLDHGREDHDRLGDPHEQGAGADRGPPPLRAALPADRGGRASAVHDPRHGPPGRRQRAGPLRPAGHEGADRLRAAPPGAAAARRADGPGGAALEFEAPDEAAFPCLALAREAGRAGGTAPAVLNAANEVAVAAFLDGRCGFMDIARVVRAALEAVPAGRADELEAVLAADARARAAAADAIEGVPAFSA